MSFNEYYFNKASEQIEQQRMLNRNEESRRHAEVCSRIPEYAQLEGILADTSSELIMLMLKKEDGRSEQLKQLEKNNLSIQQNMQALLQKGGFPADYLDRIYTCPKCRDKGTYDGKWCECFRRKMLNVAAEELNSVSPLKLSDFDSFRLDLYSDEKDQMLGTSHREFMKRNLDFCRSYAEQFTTSSEGIFMNGGTGLGKTHLSLAIANEVLKRGFNVVYGSVPELLRILDREFFGRSDENTMVPLTECDLLILDDLGAEMEKPLYTSLVYELINTRTNRGLPTIVNSNLGVNDLKTRYQDRIWSRLFSFEVLMFVGQDVRRKINR